MNRIAILTSSRADYGIYLPLLKELRKDPFFELEIIAFGTHLSKFHGYTIDNIVADGFTVSYTVESLCEGDSPYSISSSISLTVSEFAEFWKHHHSDFDIVFCLGDRYEMFAAVYSAVAFNIRFAHLHGGERTEGAIDNIFRDAITIASKMHFVSCAEHGKRVSEVIGKSKNIFNVGALSLDNLGSVILISNEEFVSSYGIDLTLPTILVTVHPETINFEANKKYIEVVAETLLDLEAYQILVTLPNADTNNFIVRERLLSLVSESDRRIKCFENLGTQAYFTAMSKCSFLLGNSSSGIIEAPSFGKYAVNLGDRQKGRLCSKNVINVPFERNLILDAIKKIELNPIFKGKNIYHKGNAAKEICSILKFQL